MPSRSFGLVAGNDLGEDEAGIKPGPTTTTINKGGRMTYEVSIAVTLVYSVEVEAESFDDAAVTAMDRVGDINRNISQAANAFVPDGVLDDVSETVDGVYKLG